MIKGLNANKNEKMVDFLFNNNAKGIKEKGESSNKKSINDFENVLGRKMGKKAEAVLPNAVQFELKGSNGLLVGEKNFTKNIEPLVAKKSFGEATLPKEKPRIEKRHTDTQTQKNISIDAQSKSEKGKAEQTKEIGKVNPLETIKKETLNVLGEFPKTAELGGSLNINKKDNLDPVRENTALVKESNKIVWEASKGGGLPTEEAKHLHQISALKNLARELTLLNQSGELQEMNINTHKEQAPKGKEMVKDLLTTIQLNFNTDKKGEMGEQNLSNSPIGKFEKSESHVKRFENNTISPSDVKADNSKKTESEITKIAELKSDFIGLQLNPDNVIKQDVVKVNGLKELGEIASAEVNEFVNLKVVNSKKIVLHVNQDNLGRVEIQIEKKGDTIHIVVKMEDKAAKDKIESSMENLKLNLDDKKIEIEYKVERESDKEDKEKRKEQEEYTKKENKREQGDKNRDLREQFEEMMGVE